MASSQTVFPKWLLDCKSHVSQTKEWNLFLGELHEAVQQQLTESHVQYFTDLTEAEKTMFVERAIRAIENGGVFTNLFSKVSLLLDQHMNEEVARELMEDHPTDTKTDLVVANAEEAALSLLRKWPDMKSKLHVCLNQPLPAALRGLAWKLFLTNTKIRKRYVDLMRKNPKQAISKYDLEISQKCETLLGSEVTFSSLKGSIGAFYAMKAVLSYHHTQSQSSNRLPDIDYMLMVPIVCVASPALSRREPASSQTVALLVEEYLSFLESRPGYMVDSGSEAHNAQMTGFVEKVAELIEQQDPDLASSLAGHFKASKDKIITTETAGHELFVNGLKSIVRPVVRALFVGYLNMSTLLYIWDQYIIGLDTPGFTEELLPVVMATFFILLRDHLLQSTTTASIENAVRSQGIKLTVAQFQYQIKQHHFHPLYRMLEKDNKAAIPVLDPTQGQQTPWRHWFNDVIPSYTRPQDRRRAREEREADRERLLQQQLNEEKTNREEEDKVRQAIEEERLRLVAEEKQKADSEKHHLEILLEQEREKREAAELRHREEMERMMLEIGALKDQQSKQRPVTTQSMASTISRVILPPPPPPSRVSRTVSQPPETAKPAEPDFVDIREESPEFENLVQPSSPSHQQTEEAILDFLRRINQSVNKIGHGEGKLKSDLDTDTKDYMRSHIRDVKRAEMAIFGRNLEENEFNRLSPSTQKDSSDQMMELIQQYRNERMRRPQRGKRR